MMVDGKLLEGCDVRGKVMMYVFNIINCSYVVFKKLKFFGIVLWVFIMDEKNVVNNLIFYLIIFSYLLYI